MKTKVVTEHKGIHILQEHGQYTFYIKAFRFAAETLDEAIRIIDEYAEEPLESDGVTEW